MKRRTLFGLAAAVPVAALPAIAAPMIEMDVADVTPIPLGANPYVSDFGIFLTEQRIQRMEWIALGEPVIWVRRHG